MKNGEIKVVLGKILVVDPVEGGNHPTITPASLGKLTINGNVIKETTVVKESDKIEFEVKNEASSRKIKVDISKNKMEAYLSLEYKSAIKRKIVDCNSVKDLTINVFEEVIETVEKFSKNDIYEALAEANITYGINEEIIEEILNSNKADNVLVAKGKSPVDAIDESVEFSFDQERDNHVREFEKIDYKNINKINSILEGQNIGRIIRGREPELGKNILGEEVKGKKNKRKIIRCGNGCSVVDDNIIAELSGQVSYKNEIVSVNKVYRVMSDVDISTGNINFEGDVQVEGNVNEGMRVCSRNNIEVTGGVFSSDVIGNSDINISGSVANSRIIAGGTDVSKQKRICSLAEFLKVYEELLESLIYLFEKGIIAEEEKIPEVIHKLLESKFKNFNKLSMEVISSAIKDGDRESLVSKFIKGKLLPISIVNIRSLEELKEFIIIILEEIDHLKQYMANISTITLNYCQEAKIQSAGDIIVNGKGLFSTELYAIRNIKFSNKQAVCRGGTLKAGESIEAAIVGSEAGVQTTVEVLNKKGTITIAIAYSNTLIIINSKRYLVTKPCRNVKCYIDKKGELIVEKLNL